MSVPLHPFTKRLFARTDRFAVSPTPPADPVIVAVKHELLVAQHVAADVNHFLTKNSLAPNIPVASLPVVFGDTGIEDVVIQPIHETKKKNVFDVTNDVRKSVVATEPDAVSPNHVLVPAPNQDFCPWGPPSPTYGEPPMLAHSGSPGEPVTVIDASYFWDDAEWGAGNNPLTALCDVDVRWAEWHKHLDGWQAGTPTVLSRNGDPSKLDALTGHANFVAGVVAQGSAHPRITVWSHNGGYRKGSDEYPTEASVCRSLWASQRPASLGPMPLSPAPGAVAGAPARIIQVGFAFHPQGDIPSAIWKLTFERIARLAKGEPSALPIIVAPAGNETSPLRRYPAALNVRVPGLPLTVLGVGSVQPGGNARSVFTNFGGWVTCAAVGEDVASTFLHVKMKLEDDMSAQPKLHDFTANDWATWNGTSFASPKVAGALAARLAAGAPSAHAAWTALQAVCLPTSTGLAVGSCVLDF